MVIRHFGLVYRYDGSSTALVIPKDRRRPRLIWAQLRLPADRLGRQRLPYNASLQQRRRASSFPRQPITHPNQQNSSTITRAGDPEGRGAGPPTMGLPTLDRVEDAPTGISRRRRRGAGEAVSSSAKGRWAWACDISQRRDGKCRTGDARACSEGSNGKGRPCSRKCKYGLFGCAWFRNPPRQPPAAPGTRGQDRVINLDCRTRLASMPSARLS
ncbi:hypothetical protein LNAOJCKE_5102 [Methylorubrum aminovorans]|uniref:Uncharacterized protein n=1 Tax=Methylorubrum aminovorans TaxID=269069 RepID=A0ABQ4UKU0_9HYPH|nr:hypothetical protein LNAOJCKE_5102 [Methylorubrum aminovorans]